jgi:tRNA dimethylallyltransferase
VRDAVEREIAERGPGELHAELEPDVAAAIHPNDRQRIARATELQRTGLEPAAPHRGGGRLWTAELRHPTVLAGLTIDSEELSRRIDARVDAMVESGALEEVAAADRAGASRTARAAIGFEQLLAGDIEATKRAQRQFARRQMTWLRRMEGVHAIDRTELSDAEVAARVLDLLDEAR